MRGTRGGRWRCHEVSLLPDARDGDENEQLKVSKCNLPAEKMDFRFEYGTGGAGGF